MKRALRSSIVATVLSFGAFSIASDARADDTAKESATLPQRKATFSWDKQVLRASVSFRDVIDKKVEQKLTSGLANVIALRIYVLREGEDNPVALSVRTCRVVYDLWDEVFRIKVSGPGQERDIAVLTLDGVLRQCAEVKDFPIADKALLTDKKAHFLGVIVDVNPVSPEMLAEMRRWVTRPPGSTGIARSDALFGSFVGLFVRQIGASDRTLKFRSQAFAP